MLSSYTSTAEEVFEQGFWRAGTCKWNVVSSCSQLLLQYICICTP